MPDKQLLRNLQEKTSCVTDILACTGWIKITRNWSNRETRIISSVFVFLNFRNHWHGIRIISHHDSHDEHRVFYYKPVPKINWMGANWEPGTLDPITLSRKDSRPWQSGSDTVSHPGERIMLNIYKIKSFFYGFDNLVQLHRCTFLKIKISVFLDYHYHQLKRRFASFNESCFGPQFAETRYSTRST